MHNNDLKAIKFQLSSEALAYIFSDAYIENVNMLNNKLKTIIINCSHKIPITLNLQYKFVFVIKLYDG